MNHHLQNSHIKNIQTKVEFLAYYIIVTRFILSQ